MCLLAIYISSLETTIQVLGPFFFFLIEWFLLLIGCRCSFCIMDITPLSVIWAANIFFHPTDYPFTLLVISFDVQFLILLEFNVSFIIIIIVLLVSCTRNHCWVQCHEAYPICFPSFFFLNWSCYWHITLCKFNIQVMIWYMYILQQASQVVLVVKKSPADRGDVRDVGSIPGSRRSPGGEHDNPLQYSCLENSMDRRAYWDIVHRVAKSQTRLKRL